MVLTQNGHSMEQNREPRDKPTLIRTINPGQREQECAMEKGILINKCCWKNWTTTGKRENGLLPYTMHNNKLKMD